MVNMSCMHISASKRECWNSIAQALCRQTAQCLSISATTPSVLRTTLLGSLPLFLLLSLRLNPNTSRMWRRAQRMALHAWHAAQQQRYCTWDPACPTALPTHTMHGVHVRLCCCWCVHLHLKLSPLPVGTFRSLICANCAPNTR